MIKISENLNLLHNKSALKSKYISNLLVSTDCEEIAKYTKKLGAEVPFLRPKKLATDKALTFPVIEHATKKMEKIKYSRYDYIILLQPTCPLRTSKDIDISLKKLILSKSKSITSIVDVGANHPLRMK